MYEQENPYTFPHDEEESVLLTLVELFTSACEQEVSRDALGASEISSRSLCQKIIKEYLQRLAHGLDPEVRQAVAAHPHAPVEILHKLSQDDDPMVRKVVAEQKRISGEILRLLTHYPNRQVQWLARFVQTLLAEYGEAGREQAWWAKLRWLFVDAPGRGWIGLFSIETQLDEVAALEIPEHLRHVLIAALATDWKGEHTFAVTDKRDAATLLRDRLIFYRHLLAPFLPPIALRKLACSPHWEVRYLMALHKHTLWETRQALSQDENRYVRAMARAKTAQIKEERAD